MFSKAQDALDIDLIQASVVQFDSGEGDLLAQFVPLALVRLGVDLLLEQERFVEDLLTMLKVEEAALQIGP